MQAVDAAAAALAFLTRIPVRRALGTGGCRAGAPCSSRSSARGSARSSGVAALLLYPSVPALAAAGVAVGVELVVTGAMHVDALADTADAAGAQTRERALEIMRDSRIGSFGAAALMTDLLVRAAAIAGLAAAPVGALVAAGALSRAASLPLAAALPYARAEGGPGSVLTGRVGVGVGAGSRRRRAGGRRRSDRHRWCVGCPRRGRHCAPARARLPPLAGRRDRRRARRRDPARRDGRPARLRRYVNSPREIAWRFARSAMSTSWPSRPT